MKSRLLIGDCLKVLRSLPPQSVHQIITSVPYWGLRDYAISTDLKTAEIGQEATIGEWVQNMVTLGRELRRVLRDDGTCWINFGDSYNSAQTRGSYGDQSKHGYTEHGSKRTTVKGMSSKCRIGQPERALIALIDDGWIYRDPIVWNPEQQPGAYIWHKNNPMPSSVDDRSTPAHEMIYMFSKKERYYYDWYGITEPSDGSDPRRARSVWTIPTEAFPGAHFATWPTELARRMIVAGTSDHGVCESCGKPWVRQLEKEKVKIDNGNRKRADAPGAEVSNSSVFRTGEYYKYKTIGWHASCKCNLVKCATCTLVLDSANQPICGQDEKLHSVRSSIHATQAEQLVLQSKVLFQSKEIARPKMSGMQQNVPPDQQAPEILRTALCESRNDQTPQECPRVVCNDEGIQTGLQAGFSRCGEIGLHNGTPISDATTLGSNAQNLGNSSSLEQEQIGQQDREFRVDDQERARPVTDGAKGCDVPPLQIELSRNRACPVCLGEKFIDAVVPAVILDPFSGSGTSGLVAARLFRNYIGIDLSHEYTEMAQRRISGEFGLFARTEVIDYSDSNAIAPF